LADSKSCCQIGMTRRSCLQLGASGRECEDIHTQDFVFQEIFSDFELLRVFVGHGQCSVSAREPMGMHHSVYVAEILRRSGGHVTIGTLLRFWRVVERTRALAGDSAGLPVVILVEAAEPTVMVHGNVEVN